MTEEGYLELLGQVMKESPSFGHRQHLSLAWRYLQSADDQTAETWMCAAIRHVAAAHGTPDKYHETLTIAWTRLVAAHVRTSRAGTFEEFMAENAELLDRHLPGRHFSRSVLEDPQARQTWVEPDLASLP